MPIFDGFSDADVETIKNAGRFVRLPEGWSPIAEQTPSDKAYIILSGEASIRRGKEEIARLGAGQMIGEAGVLGHRLRTATVVAATPLEVLHYTDEQLRQLCDQVPALREAIDRQGRERAGEAG